MNGPGAEESVLTLADPAYDEERRRRGDCSPRDGVMNVRQEGSLGEVPD